MAQLFTGSICLSDLIDMAKRQHSAYTKAQSNGKIYVNVKIWLNDEPDKYNNIIGLQLNSSKDKKETEPAFYIGNARRVEVTAPQPISASDVETLDDGLPF
jgi:hypothetical protein